MAQVTKILFPTDYSACAESAFSHAAHLAAQYGAALHTLHVVAAPRPASTVVADPVEAPGDAFEKGGVQVVSTQAQADSVSAGILTYTADHKVDLIVMGTHGRGGVSRFFEGSITETIVREATCPVLTVREGQEHTPTRKNIWRVLVPVDLSEQSIEAVGYGEDLAARYQAHLHLLHVMEDPSVFAAPGLTDEGALATLPEAQACRWQALAQRKQTSDKLKTPVRMHLTRGTPGHAIVDFAAQHDVDLIVMMAREQTGLRRLLPGGITETVIRKAPCPVFIV